MESYRLIYCDEQLRATRSHVTYLFYSFSSWRKSEDYEKLFGGGGAGQNEYMGSASKSTKINHRSRYLHFRIFTFEKKLKNLKRFLQKALT